ncbi:MAG TPA: protein PilO [Deltaproteobacteria bacterium]|nr:protein PilO [Deltaproteobacteria bacterium]
MKKISDSLSGISQKVVDLPTPQKVLILILTILLIGGGFYYVVYKDNSAKITKLEKDIRQMQSRLATLKKKSRELKKLEKEVAKERKRLIIVAHLLPKSKEIPSLLESISKSGTEARLEFLLFKPKKEQPKNFYAEIPIDIEVRGTYHQVAMFLDKLSHLERIVSARNLSMARAGEHNDEIILKTKCTAVTYRYIESPPNNKKKKKKRKRR